MKSYKALLLIMLLVFSLLIVGCDVDSPVLPSHTPITSKGPEETIKPSPIEEILVDEELVFDDEDIKIWVKSFDDNGIFGPSLELLIENNREEDIMVQVRGTTVNDVVVNTIFSVNVSAGKEASKDITLMQSSLDKAGIELVKDIELRFVISDGDNWATILATDPIKISTSVDPSFKQEYDDSGQLILDQDGIRIIVRGIDNEDTLWGASVELFIENNQDQGIRVQAKDVSVNGFAIDSLLSSEIPAGKKAYAEISFAEADLKEHDIKTIEEIEMVLHISEIESWDSLLISDPITVSFK
ncbi:MAG: hypothetical protein WC097_07230 [Eubacteriales bacterium]|jgi:hypothetical protein|nr:hypothetical protein [Bacillota bacterium]